MCHGSLQMYGQISNLQLDIPLGSRFAVVIVTRCWRSQADGAAVMPIVRLADTAIRFPPFKPWVSLYALVMFAEQPFLFSGETVTKTVAVRLVAHG